MYTALCTVPFARGRDNRVVALPGEIKYPLYTRIEASAIRRTSSSEGTVCDRACNDKRDVQTHAHRGDDDDGTCSYRTLTLAA